MNLTGVFSNNSIYTTTSMPVQASDRTQSKIPKSKTTFKLVLEVFCAWQAYVKQRRARKTEKKRLLTLIIRAINFNEHTLMIKSMRGFSLANKINKRVAFAYKKVRRRHNHALLHFYLRKMVNARL